MISNMKRKWMIIIKNQ